MNAYQAQRIRFGILAARHTLARETMTPDQVDYLEGSRVTALAILFTTGAIEAYSREKWRITYAGV